MIAQSKLSELNHSEEHVRVTPGVRVQGNDDGIHMWPGVGVEGGFGGWGGKLWPDVESQSPNRE